MKEERGEKKKKEENQIDFLPLFPYVEIGGAYSAKSASEAAFGT